MYLLSIGPACWIASRLPDSVDINFVSGLYLPVIWVCRYSPLFVNTWVEKYAEYGGNRENAIYIWDNGIEIWFKVRGPVSVCPFETQTSGGIFEESKLEPETGC